MMKTTTTRTTLAAARSIAIKSATVNFVSSSPEVVVAPKQSSGNKRHCSGQHGD
jgi:hypothetical protein